MIQNLYISPKHLGILEELHLLYMLANFLLKIKRFEGENFRFEQLVPTDRRAEAVFLYHVLCILVPSSAKSRKILIQQKRNKRRSHTIKY